ncbi:meiotically up-regulated 65 [Fusarium longipes]|uniref:Meiotically up-regulated 65 n=1 Tax=Fusarium longipes TaxID=694270 RepID=A0A395RQ80_9HYPO|nr:meiotically up-regulated 65 [Fusarium longipes]
MLKVKSLRRPAGLKPTDYDHEIALVDHDAAATPTGLLGTEEEENQENQEQNRNGQNGEQQDNSNKKPDGISANGHDDSHTEDGNETHPPSNHADGEQDLPPQARPSIEVQGQQELSRHISNPSNLPIEPTPDAFHGDHPLVKPTKPRVKRETAIDILYENERGGFLCGIPLFSSQALGGLDPPAWTNGYHKASPSNIHNAQVPDPTWEWAWPEWRINHQDGVDEHGWEYSFHFSKKFSWHSGKWWNSFVRRRAWTRKRIRKRDEDVSADPHMLNTDYFTIQSAAHKARSSHASMTSSRLSQSSVSQISAGDADEVIISDIDNVQDLMHALREARIDREKLDAVNNYMEHAEDLQNLQHEMHEIMSLFVFQQSRRILLSRLMEIHDETTAQVKKTNTTELRERNQALKDAIHHADEEVRKLAYWSDVKQMAESGETQDAVKGDKGWDASWEGVDQSGGAPPLRDKATVNGKSSTKDT